METRPVSTAHRSERIVVLAVGGLVVSLAGIVILIIGVVRLVNRPRRLEA